MRLAGTPPEGLDQGLGPDGPYDFYYDALGRLVAAAAPMSAAVTWRTFIHDTHQLVAQYEDGNPHSAVYVDDWGQSVGVRTFVDTVAPPAWAGAQPTTVPAGRFVCLFSADGSPWLVLRQMQQGVAAAPPVPSATEALGYYFHDLGLLVPMESILAVTTYAVGRLRIPGPGVSYADGLFYDSALGSPINPESPPHLADPHALARPTPALATVQQEPEISFDDVLSGVVAAADGFFTWNTAGLLFVAAFAGATGPVGWAADVALFTAIVSNYLESVSARHLEAVTAGLAAPPERLALAAYLDAFEGLGRTLEAIAGRDLVTRQVLSQEQRAAYLGETIVFAGPQSIPGRELSIAMQREIRIPFNHLTVRILPDPKSQCPECVYAQWIAALVRVGVAAADDERAIRSRDSPSRRCTVAPVDLSREAARRVTRIAVGGSSDCGRGRQRHN
jgi:YD repeat-containing protein